MQNNSKISAILQEVMRFCAAHQPNDNSEPLRLSLKNLQQRPGNDYRTTIAIGAGLKCLDEYIWLQIQLQETRSKIFFAAHETENCKDLEQRERLALDTLAQLKLLDNINLASNRVNESVKEFLLNAMTYIMGQTEEEQAAAAATLSIAPDSTIADQLKTLNEVVSSAREKLTARIQATEEAIARDNVSELSAATFEFLLGEKALSAVFTFGEKLLERATSLSEVAINTLPMFGNLSDDNTKQRKQWLLVYAIAAATIADVSEFMTQEAFHACGGQG